jgi:hypothetical protein
VAGEAPGEDRLSAAAVLAFFVVVFFYFSHPLADGDLWWHLNTGRWIVTHRALPSADPFTYTVSPAFQERARMFVRANWLAEVVYFAVYRVGGFGGLRLFNAALFTAVAGVIYLTLRRPGLGRWWALLFTAPCVAAAWYYDELRPLGFSILLTAISLHLLERSREGQGGKCLAALVPLTVLWANLHRGFPLLYLVLGPYAVVWLWQKRRREARWVIAAAAASVLNPSGLRPVRAALSEAFQGTGRFLIIELARPWRFARVSGVDGLYWPMLLTIAAASLLLLGLEWRRVRAEHAIAYALFAAAGFTAFRYSIYFVVVAAAVVAPYAARVLGARSWRPVAVAVLVAMGSMVRSAAPLTTQSVYTGFLPEKAVAALVGYRLPGPLLNPYDWGGYISWVTWPRYEVFADSRLLDYSVYDTLQRLLREPAAPVLDAYGVNTVIHPTADVAQAGSFRIVLELMADPKWKLVFSDPRATVFVRRSAAPGVPEVSKDPLGAYLLSLVARRMQARPAVPGDHFEIAAILQAIGRQEAAARAQAAGLALAKAGGRP